MKILMKLSFFPLLLAAAPPSDQFNLNCTGTRTTSSFFGDKADQYSATYRFDLAQKKWCEGECEALQTIAAILPTQIQLQNDKVDTVSERSMTVNFIDRETGAHMMSATSSSPRDARSIVVMKWLGQCDRAAFTGFPKFATKF